MTDAQILTLITDYITTNNNGEITAVKVKEILDAIATDKINVDKIKTVLTDNSDSYVPSQKAVKTEIDALISAIALKQDELVSGTNIKTLNGSSLLGPGDLVVSSPAGVFGISDSSGVYTYYSNLTLVMAAAVSGDTIKFFANVEETSDVEITIKDGVNVDFNGYSYTLNTTGTSSNFLVEGKGQTVNFYNGRIIRTGGTLSTSNSACIVFGSSVASVYDSCYLNFYDVEILNDFGAGITPNATNIYLSASIYGAKVNTFGQGIKTQKANTIRGLIMNCTSNTYGGGDAIVSNTSCDVIKCVATTTNGGTALVISQSGIGTDCYASTTGTGSSPAINCSYATRVENCVVITTRGRGIYNTGGCPVYNTKIWCTSSSSAVETGSGASGSIYNCDIYASASTGALYQKYVENCNIKSLFSYAVQGITTASSYIRGGVYYSSASQTIYGANECFNATVINEYNNANGHGLIFFQPTAEILNNVIKITNASAYGLFNSTAQTFKYSSNVLSGGAGMVNANITQGISNTTDSQGNIQI